MSFIARTIIILVHLTSISAYGESDVLVFDVRKPIAMSKQEKPEKDYYINSGLEVGLKRGFVVTVVRRSSLYDAYQNKSPGELVVPVGKLRIIHSQKGLSVGRLISLFDRDNLPIVEYEHIMVGDRLDLGSVTAGEKKKEAKNEEPAPKPVEARLEVQEEIKAETAPAAAPAPAEEGKADQSSTAPKSNENVNLPSLQ